MLILALILFGMVVGGAAQFILGRDEGGIDWPLAFAAGLIGSFTGGLLLSVPDDGDATFPEIVTAGWRWWKSRSVTS